MDNKWTVLWIILDRSHALILLTFEKDLSDVTEVAPAVTIILWRSCNSWSRCVFLVTITLTLWLLFFNWWTHIRRSLEVVQALKWVNWYHSHLWNVSPKTFNSSVTSCLPIAFKSNWSACVNSLNVGWLIKSIFDGVNNRIISL